MSKVKSYRHLWKKLNSQPLWSCLILHSSIRDILMSSEKENGMERMEMDKLVGKQQNASHEMRPHLQQAAPSLSQSFPKRSSASQPDLLLPISRSTLCLLQQTRTLPTILRSFSLIKVKLDFLDPCQQL